ncbi:MAG: NUDIX domain-containing protein [Patescibacteria group bacterium]|jgi:8-oxo-dGTP diphosphatase
MKNIDFDKIGLLVVLNDKILFCRKKDYTSKLILPGGKIEAGEDDITCLRREIKEELGSDNKIVGDPSYIGTYIDKAASDDESENKIVRIKLYQGNIAHEARPTSEIKEIVWFTQGSDRNELSPIIKNKIFPDLIKRGILKWKM